MIDITSIKTEVYPPSRSILLTAKHILWICTPVDLGQDWLKISKYIFSMPVIFMLTALLTFVARPAHADPYAWCAVYSVSGSTSCNFMTLEQCQTMIAGIGGFCQPNPSYTGRQAPIGHRQPTARDLPADVLQSEERATPSNDVPKICKGC